MYANQVFTEFINQGDRECVVIAENGTKFLYEYEMPNGTSCVRNEKNRPIPYLSLPAFWLRLIEDQFGLQNLICQPQQSGHHNVRKELQERLASVTKVKLNQEQAVDVARI